ncbi:helix-turn-helix domain-containing protein [Loktanella sp. Alg231-35]|uniref:helix-turn-helix domain-containing protein n=1 Tax=Loktanella sp. Alg231-35 TaxID=1922220 RepID=UPI000D54BFE1
MSGLCAVWEAVATQSADLGFNVRRITRIASRLETRGLLLRTACKGGRRFGRRGGDGRIIVAGGINLGPMVEQAGDLMRLIQHQAQDPNVYAMIGNVLTM